MNAAAIATNPEMQIVAEYLVSNHPYFTAFFLGCLVSVALWSRLSR